MWLRPKPDINVLPSLSQPVTVGNSMEMKRPKGKTRAGTRSAALPTKAPSQLERGSVQGPLYPAVGAAG